MSCKQKRQLVRFPKVRILKQWFRHFNDHKEFHNEGNLHLFSLMALFSYANFRSNERVINGVRYMEAPGQWVCKLGSLPRILRVHSKAQALDLMKYFEEKGFLQFEVIDEDQEIIRYTINDWKRHCTHLAYNYYSYKGSGFFFFPLPIGRLLLRAAKTEGRIVFSELYYDFFAEAYYNGKWYNIDFFTMGQTGKLKHQYLYSVSRSFLGRLSTVIDHAAPLKFQDLAEGTRKILREDAQPQYEDSLELETFFYAGDLHDFEALLDAPYEYEYFVTRNQVAALQAHLIDDFSECLTAKDVIELPEDARDEYVLYHWDYPTNSRQIVQQIVDKLHEQLDFFNDSIPYQSGASSTDQRAASVRVVYRLS